MPTRTRAAVFRDGALTLEQIKVAPPGPGQVAVDIRAVGVCHSDLHIVNGDWREDRPLVLGHEAAGVVAEVGEPESGIGGMSAVAPGDHVVLSWFAPCRRCRNCAAGRPWLCTGTVALENALPGLTTAFRDADDKEIWPFLGLGGFSGRVIVPESAVIPVPAELPFEIGALLGCAVTTGIGAVTNTAKVPAGSSAVVIGCGGVGLSTVMGLELAGAHPIIAVDVSDDKLATATELGATETLRADRVDVTEAVRELLGGTGADYAFEAIGRPASIESLPGMLAPGGIAVIVGMTPQGARVTFDPFDLADQGKSILGCNYGSSVGVVDIPMLTARYLAGKLPLDALVGRSRPLAEARAAIDDLERGVGLRTILVPD
jgi:S-(hydroxymethyl)glutathione dehydrogenase/alcohol dehydrogenase